MGPMSATRYIPLVTLAVAFLLGFAVDGGQNFVWILPLAFVNVLALAQPRLKQAREQSVDGRANALLEGLYLLALQLLILGAAYIIGFLIGNAVPIASLS